MTLFSPDIVYFEDPVGMSFWVTGHYYEHQAMLQKGLAVNFQVPDYDLYGWSPDDEDRQKAWLEMHSLVHDSLRQLTGVTGPDYADVNFAVKREFDDWMWYHSTEHIQLRQALGLT